MIRDYPAGAKAFRHVRGRAVNGPPPIIGTTKRDSLPWSLLDGALSPFFGTRDAAVELAPSRASAEQCLLVASDGARSGVSEETEEASETGAAEILAVGTASSLDGRPVLATIGSRGSRAVSGVPWGGTQTIETNVSMERGDEDEDRASPTCSDPSNN